MKKTKTKTKQPNKQNKKIAHYQNSCRHNRYVTERDKIDNTNTQLREH